MPFYIDNRKIKIVTGRKSQTINVYVDNDLEGIYDPKLRINSPASFITEELLQQQGFHSVNAMITFLVDQRGAVTEVWKHTPTGGRFKVPREAIPGDQEWARRVIPEVEGAINTLLDEFRRFPYLHRVEHSIHCELYRHLIQSKVLHQLIDFGTFETGAVHKEWPETKPRPEKGNRRGNFDLAILAPPTANTGAVDVIDFRRGFIAPAVVIELGLDYGLDHLRGDAEKLRNSNVEHGYLVHLARPMGEPQNDVEEYVIELIENEKNGGPLIAYVNVGADEIQYRRLRDPVVTTQKV